MVTEVKIIKFLKEFGIINKNKYKNNYVLPRTMQSSHLLERKYDKKEKPETSLALNRIKIINNKISIKYTIFSDLLIIEPFGKTYSLSINKKVLDKINKYKQSKNEKDNN